MPVILALFSLATTGWLLLQEPASFEVFTVMTAVTAGLAVASFAIGRAHDLTVFRAFGVLFCLFHLGLVVNYVLTENLREYFRMVFWWFGDNHPTRAALRTSLFFLAGILIGYVVALRTSRPVTREATFNESLHTCAMIALVVSCSIWFVSIILYGGVRDYPAYIQFVRTSPIMASTQSILNSIIASSFFLAAVNTTKPMRALIPYGLWSLLAFPIGLRGEVLFPLALTVPVIISMETFRLRKMLVVGVAIATLSLSSIVFITRAGGSVSEAAAAASPLNGLGELGGTLRPVYEVNEWLMEGDSLRYGTTYTAPFERAVLLVFPFAERPPAESDTRLMNVLIRQRAGPYGFSIAAEAMINFGFFGTMIAGLCYAALMIFANRKMLRFPASLIYPAVAYAVFFHIRQSFVGAFGALVVFLALGLLLRYWAWTMDQGRAGSRTALAPGSGRLGGPA